MVCSALSGVSNMLDELLPAAIGGGHEEVLARIEEAHEKLATSLGLDLDTCVGAHLKRLKRLALGASLIGESSPKLKAQVMAMGELMSTTIGAAFLGRARPDRGAVARCARVPRCAQKAHDQR